MQVPGRRKLRRKAAARELSLVLRCLAAPVYAFDFRSLKIHAFLISWNFAGNRSTVSDDSLAGYGEMS